MPKRGLFILPLALLLALTGGCATLRTTDPPRTATELFLLNVATERAVEKLNLTALRDRKVFLSEDYIFGPTSNAGQNLSLSNEVPDEQSYLVGEVRARMLAAGARLVASREEAEVIAEVRVQALGIDKLEYVFGIPAIAAPSAEVQGVPLLTPEIAFLKKLNQQGYSAVGIVSYWKDSGELLDSRPIEIGETSREDFWIFGIGPRTVGDIPPAGD